MYQIGDYVYPADLPRRFVCRVAEVESFDVPAGTSQILELAPLEGPWPAGTLLIRPARSVRPAEVGNHPRLRASILRPPGPRLPYRDAVIPRHGEAA